MPDFHGTAKPHIEALLEPGEALRGFCAASQTSLFKGRLVALIVTDRRLIVLPLNRRIEPDGEPLSLPPERIADADAGGAGGGWVDISASVMNRAAITLKLRTTDGEKLKLNMMRGDAPLGGGPEQAEGVAAVGAFFATDR